MHNARSSSRNSFQTCTDAARSPFSLMSGAYAQAYRHAAPVEHEADTRQTKKGSATLLSLAIALFCVCAVITAIPM